MKEANAIETTSKDTTKKSGKNKNKSKWSILLQRDELTSHSFTMKNQSIKKNID
jgi:hypothetical protein